MKIKNISCTQFAGLRNADISLNDGINIIYGKNESGKSTLVNLISRTLFQNIKLDGRSNKDFLDLYFPSAMKNGGAVGDFVDGKLSFETEDGTYTLSKEWGADARCTLSTPNGAVRGQKQIDEILYKALVYGEGVYSDMLFPSQKNADVSLQTLLDASKKTDAKQEISDAVTMAFAESGGVPVDAIGQAIEDKIREIEGQHWDAEKSVPARRSVSGRWSIGVGEILRAYYDLEDAKAVLYNISALEAEADSTLAEYNERNNAACRAETEFDTFSKYANLLETENEQREKITRLNAEIEKYSEIVVKLPKLTEELKKAKALYAEKANRTVFDKYRAAKKLADGISEYKQRLDGIGCPSHEEILTARNEQKRYLSLNNKLCGMNITSRIKLLGGHGIVVKSLRTGEELEFDENMTLTEAVSITVPDVMEMRLAPADTDAEEIKKQLDKSKAALDEIFSKYEVNSVDELENRESVYKEMYTKIENAENRLSMILEGTTLDELSAQLENIADIRETADINSDILSLCGRVDIAAFITQHETQISLYENEYTGIDALKDAINIKTDELNRVKESVKEGDIPKEYLNIANPDAYLDMLKNEVQNARKLREDALSEKAAASGRLEAYREGLDSDPIERVHRAEDRFKEQEELLKHWKHIEKVFNQKKDELSDNPMQDIAEQFTYYLTQISGGKVSSEFTEQDKLSMNIYSSDRLLDYGKLSEGTKETVFLAFRLAALDHLFPSGGGVLVLDDPFTDMDAERTALSCELLKDFAKRHQVIFLTCKEEYVSLLGGNEIRI